MLILFFPVNVATCRYDWISEGDDLDSDKVGCCAVVL